MSEELIELPPVRCVTEVFNPGDAEHMRQWRAAGSPEGGWSPSFYEDLQEDGQTYVRRPAAAAPDPIAKAAETYEQAAKAAETNIFKLMATVAGAMILYAPGFDDTNVNEEGGEFVDFHQAPINAYKLSGRGPAKALALYNAVASITPRPFDPEGPSSRTKFPWLDQALPGGGTILDLFAIGLGVNP